MRKQKNENQRTVFRRINGRIIPISVTVTGTGIAADAARTTQVYKKGATVITQKKFAIQPFVYHTLGTRLDMKVGGKKVGKAMFYKNFGKGKDATHWGFSWLGIKKEFRGAGHSKLLSHIAGRSIKTQGGTHTFNQVVHKGSALTNYSGARDKFFKAKEVRGMADYLYKRVSLKKALGNIAYHRDKKGIMTSDVFRETSLKGLNKLKGFKTTAMKARIGAGIAIAAVGAYALYKTRGNNGSK